MPGPGPRTDRTRSPFSQGRTCAAGGSTSSRRSGTETVKPIALAASLVGRVDRDQAVAEALNRLGAARSAWNAADIRGEVEQLIARAGIIADAVVRGELAEDLTARTLTRCIPLLARTGVPDHVRALTSPRVLNVEADISGRVAVRGAEPATDADPGLVARIADDAGQRLDDCQVQAVAVLAGGRPLVVVEGAAGAGKTTTLAATRDLLTEQGHRLVVVTPTLKAAKAAAAEVGAQAGSAAWLAHQHGWRWTDTGIWTRLSVGDDDPVTGRTFAGPSEHARLRSGGPSGCGRGGHARPRHRPSAAHRRRRTCRPRRTSR